MLKNRKLSITQCQRDLPGRGVCISFPWLSQQSSTNRGLNTDFFSRSLEAGSLGQRWEGLHSP